jgi:hypothetical protein
MLQAKGSKFAAAIACLAGVYLIYLSLLNAHQLWQLSGRLVTQKGTLSDCNIRKLEGGGFAAGFTSSTQYVGLINFVGPGGEEIQVKWQGLNPPPAELCSAGASSTLMVLERGPSLAVLADHPESKNQGLLLTLIVQLVSGLLVVRLAGLALGKPAA